MSKYNAKHLTAVLITACVLLTISASTAFATVARFMDLPSLVKISDVIVRGKAVKQKQVYDKVRKISLTQTTIQVEKVLFGQSKKSIIIQQFGGTHDGLTTKIAGDASFEVGEEVVVFLRKGKGNIHYLNAMSQAKYTVQRHDGKISIKRDLSGLTFLKAGETKITPITETKVKIASFESKLKTAIKNFKNKNKENK